MKSEVFPYYPVFLNIRDKKCVVVGGGKVALRKVKTLLEHGAEVEIISPDICAELNKLVVQKNITTQKRNYHQGDLKGACIAIAATGDNDVNHKIIAGARKHNVLVNVVDDGENSDFILPAYMRRGDIAIAISTSGRSPALARKIRDKLNGELDKEYASLALLMDEVRTELKLKGIKLETIDWQKAIDLDLMINLLKKRKKEKAKATLLNNLKILTGNTLNG